MALPTRSSGGYDGFPSLSNGINGLKDFDRSLNRIVSGAEYSSSSSHNSRFQFFRDKRNSTVNDTPPSNDIATREDSLVKAWRTVSEIDALLGSDFRPSSAGPCGEERSSVDDSYVKRLNTELEAALHVSLSFKERLRDSVLSASGRHLASSAASSVRSVDSTSTGPAGAGTPKLAGETGTPGGGQAAFGTPGTPSPSRHPVLPASDDDSLTLCPDLFHSTTESYTAPTPRAQAYSATPLRPQSVIASTTSSPLPEQASTPSAAASGIAPPLMRISASGQAHSPAPPPPGGVPSPRTAHMVATVTAAAHTASEVAASIAPPHGAHALGRMPCFNPPHLHGPSDGHPQHAPVLHPQQSMQLAAALHHQATLQRQVTLQRQISIQPGLQGGLRRPPGLGFAGRLAVGSMLDHGMWDSDGGWQPADPVNDVYIPAHLQLIHPDDLVKVRELGRGCFGSVWLVRWRGVEVALKELLNQSITDGPPSEVFSEAERLASLRHPCIIAFYGIVTVPGSYATVVEYMRMGSLKSGLARLRKQGVDVSPRVRAAIALQAARGMEYLHGQFVVHFDLKCDNLLCDLRDPCRPVVKIGDLGLSKKKKDSFVSGNMRGTLPWMAPELFPGVRERDKQTQQQQQREGRDGRRRSHTGSDGMDLLSTGGGVNGAADGVMPQGGPDADCGTTHELPDDRVNEKVDVFSFGIVLWEIWQLGEQPYNNMSLTDIFGGIMTGSLRPAIPPECDPGWAALMQACWHGTPRARPSFSEIADRLDAIQDRLALLERSCSGQRGSSWGSAAGGPTAAVR